MKRAYSILTVEKALDEDGERVIRGIATTPTPDRAGDIVESMGLTFNNPMPLLHQHDHHRPVGTVIFDAPTEKGVSFTARIAKVAEPGALKDRVDTAWGEVKAGLIRAVSIGFRALDDGVEYMKGGGVRFLKSEVVELSLVTVPANADAVISTIKSIDADVRAASGHTPSADKPGASAVKLNANPKRNGKMAKKTLAEQIAAFEATRHAKSARMAEIMDEAAEEGETLNAEQQDEFDELDGECKSIDAHIKRLNIMQKSEMANAKPVDASGSDNASDARAGVVHAKAKNTLPKGTAFARMAMALAASRGNKFEAMEYAKRWDNSTPEVARGLKATIDGSVEKAAMAAGTVTDADWAAPLVEYQNMASEFVELLRPQTIIGRIEGLRRVPFNIKMPTQTQGSTVGWVGEGAPKPVGELKFGQISLGMTKAAGIIVLTEELVMSSSPSAEGLVRSDLTAQMAQFLDAQFVNPAVAEVANTSPAAITNGATYITASGTDAAAVRADVQSLYGLYLAANLTPAGGVWIMRPTTALTLSMMQNALGQPEFPNITMMGGTFFGLPVITSENIAQSVLDAGASPGTVVGDHIILARASDVLLADDGGVRLDVSREASLQMDSAPSAGAQSLVSLWQNNLVGLRAERFINWKRRRDESVVYISGANYVA